MTMQKPTEQDMGRDLAADLAGIETLRLIPYGEWLERSDALNEILDDIAPAAIRRAAAAEAKVTEQATLIEALKAECGAHLQFIAAEQVYYLAVSQRVQELEARANNATVTPPTFPEGG